MNPYSVNPHRDDEYLVPKRDLKGNVVHYRRKRCRENEEDSDRFYLAMGMAVALMFGTMFVSWIHTPM